MDTLMECITLPSFPTKEKLVLDALSVLEKVDP